MKITTIPRRLLLLTLVGCCLAACDNEDEFLSSIQETTLEGEASTVDINMKHDNWYIASVTDSEGLTIRDENKQPLYLESLGSLQFSWGSIIRNQGNALTVKLEDNFDKATRGLIINLKATSGFYTESITIRQKQCQTFYQIESVTYTLEEDDRIEEARTRPWGITWINKIIAPEEITTITFNPIYKADIDYQFECKSSEFNHNWLNPEGDNRYVDMPKDIKNGRIIYEDQKMKYTDRGMYFYESMGEAYEMNLVGWKRNKYSADIYYKRLQVTYTMTLSRLGSDTRKVIKGKLVKEFPYDCSPVRCQVSDLEAGD